MPVSRRNLKGIRWRYEQRETICVYAPCGTVTSFPSTVRVTSACKIGVEERFRRAEIEKIKIKKNSRMLSEGARGCYEKTCHQGERNTGQRTFQGTQRHKAVRLCTRCATYELQQALKQTGLEQFVCSCGWRWGVIETRKRGSKARPTSSSTRSRFSRGHLNFLTGAKFVTFQAEIILA
jgi:hypothetical protein